jgi:hypothetical protein
LSAGDPTARNLALSRPEDVELVRHSWPRSRATVIHLSTRLGLEEGHRAKLERRINRDRTACGCNEGALAGLVYLAAVPTIVMGTLVPQTFTNWALAAGGFLIALAAGKGFGLLLARWRLLWTLAKVERIMRRTAGGDAP